MNDPDCPQVVAICMATFDPDPDLFRTQVDSIRAQEGVGWHCFISDDGSDDRSLAGIEAVIGGDERFTFSAGSGGRLGFYRNFERAIRMVPEEYELFALSDQDDLWHPDKLASLVAGLGNSQLVYSDQRLVSEDGTLIANTYWSTRKNNFADIASLLIANTVTGAASLFRRQVVETALPFPDLPGEQYHDHWLAMVALALGEIHYVDRSLYDYVQHGGAVLGHEKANAGNTSLGSRRLDPRQWRGIFAGWASAYFDVFLRLKAISQIVLERCGSGMSPAKRRPLERFASSDRTVTGLLWLAFRPLRRFTGHNETLGMERVLVRGIFYRHLMGVKRRLPTRLRERLTAAAGEEAPDEHGFTGQMRRKVAPLFPVISKTQPQRVNLLIPTIDLEHLFGGYIAKFNLARRLAESGLSVRIVTVDPTPPLPDDWKQQVESYSHLNGLFEKVEINFGRDGREPLRLSPEDRFIATTWWTAHIASRLATQVSGDGRFIYMIQEYEPLTVPPGGWQQLARQSYGFPHLALFSTEILRDYFADKGVGVFAGGLAAGSEVLTFRNAITPIEAPTEADLAGRPEPRLIFYGRPEAHAARNLYEVGIEGLRRVIAQGVFGPEWRFFGIGSTGPVQKVDLGGGRSLELMPRTDQSAYGELLAGYDLGMALMDAPHPSLVPMEMASAGMLVVTTTYGESKTSEKMAAISPSLIACSPDAEGVTAGLRQAAGRITDYPGRVAGAAVDWPDDWDDSLDNELVSRITGALGLSGPVHDE